MEVDAGVVMEYYRRAAELAGPQWKRQDTGTDTTVPTSTVDTTSSVVSTSSVASVSSQSVLSTSSQSSVASTSSTATASRTSTTSLSSVTSDISTTLSTAIMTTNSAGQIITTTIVVVPTGSNSGGTSKKSTNTGPIVGGVVGGVALIALLGVCFWLIRRKMRKDEFEANIFDPDRNVVRPTSIGAGRGFDLGGAGIAGAGAAGAGAAAMSERTSNVTTYPYPANSTGPTSTYHGSSVAGAPEMQQQSPVNSGYYGDQSYPYGPQQQQQQYANIPSVGVGETFPNPYAPGYHPAGYGAGAGFAAGAAAAGLDRGQTTSSSGYPPGSTVYSSEGRVSPSGSPPMGATAGLAPGAPLNPRSAKEREAFSRSNNNFAVVNPNEPVAPPRTNPSPTPSRNSAAYPTSPVVVHQDGGRAPEPEEPSPEGEIPPTYDSIPRDAR